MADEQKTIIIDVQVEDKDFDQEIGKVNTQLRKNREEIKELSKDYENNATAIAKLESENKDLSKSKQQLTKDSKVEANSLSALRAKVANLTKERNNLDTSTKEGQKQFQALNKQILENTNQLKQAEQAGGDFRRNVGNYAGELQNAVPGFAAAKAGLVSMTTAARAFIATPLGAVIAGIVLAMAALKAAFTGSEEGQNKFARIMAQINVVLGNFMDLLADVGEAIIEAFENPGESIAAFGKLIRDNIVTRFNGLLNLIPNLAKAVEQLFAGNFAEAGKIAADAVGQVTLGVESVTDSFNAATEAVKGFIAETEKEIGIAGKVEDARAKADILARELLVDRARLESEIAALRLKSRQEEEFTAEERKKALLEAQDLQDTLLAREKEVLELRAFAQEEENKFSRSTKENLDAEAEANAAVLRVEATRTTQQITTQRELNRLNREIARDELKLNKEREKASADKIKAIQKESEAIAKANDKEVKGELALLKLKEDANKAALNSLISTLGQGEKFTKAATLATIAQDTAKAISALTAASEANPANAVSFGGAGILQFVAGLARIGANIASATSLIKGGSSIATAVPSGSGGGSVSGGATASISGGLSNVNASLLTQFSSPAQAQADQNASIVRAVSGMQSTVSVVDINRGIRKRAVKVKESTLS